MYVRDITMSSDGSQRSFGFFTGPGQWREQAAATEVMIDLIPDPRLEVETMFQEPKGAFAYWFKGFDGRPVLMAWHAGEGEVKREFHAKGEVATLVDMLGKQIQTIEINAEGKFTVTLSEAPVYVVAAAKEEVEKVVND